MDRLLYFTSSLGYMSVTDTTHSAVLETDEESRSVSRIGRWIKACNPFGGRMPSSGTVTFANNYFIIVLGWAIFSITCIADVYALVSNHTAGPHRRL